MFIVASFSIASGLNSSMERLTDSFESEFSVVTKPGPTGPEMLVRNDFGSVISHAAIGAVSEATVYPSGQSGTVFSLLDSQRVLNERFDVQPGYVLAGTALALSGNITLESEGTRNVTVSGKFSSGMFPSTWILGTEDLLMALMGESEERFNYAIVLSLNFMDAAAREEGGFCIQDMLGVLDFLGTSVDEVENDALWVLVPSAFAIAVLAYCFIGSEISDRRHDIGILKTIGAGRSRVLQYLLLNSVIISTWGGLLGLALGIVVSYAISTAASAYFTSVFVLEIHESLLVISFLTTLAAGVAGGFLPSLRMAITPPVEDLKEVTPFS